MLNFWKTHQTKYPQLFKLFKILYTIPATSTPSERLFSDAGYQVWDRRNKISPERVEQVMFIFENDKNLQF